MRLGMIKKAIIVLMLVLIILMVSCTKSGQGNYSAAGYKNSYNYGTDMQYFQLTELYRSAWIQEYEKGCYLCHGKYVYYLDREKREIRPLCSKPNCLHDKETDEEKRQECNAYMDDCINTPEGKLMYYQNWVYVCFNSSEVDFEKRLFTPSAIYKIAADGSVKEKVYAQNRIEEPMIHRGYLYFYTTAYLSGEKEGVSANHLLYRLKLEGKSTEPELIFTPDVQNVSHGGYLRGYGSLVLFDTDSQDSTEYTGCYDTETGAVSMIPLPAAHPTWYNGMLYGRQIIMGQNGYQMKIIRSKMEGTQIENVKEDLYPPGYCLTSDGRYLYVTTGMHELDDPESEDHFWVYDKNMELVDDFAIPKIIDDYSFDPPVGGTQYQYLLFEDNETDEWGVYIWDKSEIGTLHGKPYTQQKVVYQDRK